MATYKTFRGNTPVLGLELTDTEARVVHLARQGSRLNRLAQLQVLFEDTPTDERDKVLRKRGQALRAALDEAGISTRHVVVSLPRDRVILRELELPGGTEAELRQMAELKMERELPFPIEQMAMGLRVLARENDTQRVLTAFVKSDRLEGQFSVLESAGLEPVGAGVSALYAIQAFQLTEGFVPGMPQGLVSVGQTMTEIAVLNGTESLLSRSASAGLNRVDPQAGPESEGNRAFLDEVARTFTSFHGGKDPIETIYLADHGAGPSGISELLATRFDVPIEPLHPFKSGQFTTSETFDGDHIYATATGAAASYLTGADEIDFIPPAKGLLDWLQLDRKLVAMILGGLALISLYVVPPIHFAQMSEKIDTIKRLRRDYAETAKGYKVYRDKVQEIGPWRESRTPWIEVLEHLSRRIDTKRAYLTHIQFRDRGTLILRGVARTSKDCAGVADLLNKEQMFKADLKDSGKGRRSRSQFVYSFTIQIELQQQELGGKK